MNILDIITIIIIILIIVYCYSRGFIKNILSFINIIITFLTFKYLYFPVNKWIIESSLYYKTTEMIIKKIDMNKQENIKELLDNIAISIQKFMDNLPFPKITGGIVNTLRHSSLVENGAYSISHKINEYTAMYISKFLMALLSALIIILIAIIINLIIKKTTRAFTGGGVGFIFDKALSIIFGVITSFIFLYVTQIIIIIINIFGKYDKLKILYDTSKIFSTINVFDFFN